MRSAGVGLEVDDLPLHAPERIRPGVMVQRWERLSFLHWRYEPAAVARLLPTGLSIDEHEGAAWVGVVPFTLTVGLPWLQRIPWASRFPEVNVRTYVRGPDGRRGIWFLSLDASRFGAVLVARSTYRLPYMWARMRSGRTWSEARYAGVRRWPGSGDARFDIRVRIAEPIPALSALERFLTCRWRLFSPRPLALPASRIGFDVTIVDHPPWPLHRAEPTVCAQSLLSAAGLPAPGDDPLAHFSPGVSVRFAGRRRVTDGSVVA
jgi:uncharacterized protein YqjF (DUF2071 family)